MIPTTSMTSSLQSTERVGQGAIRDEWQSPHASIDPNSIHILDDNSLLNIFYLYRVAIFGEEEDEIALISGGREWDRERWWYKLTHVCQRWRKLILGSPSHLGVCILCTYGTPVADVLAHSPPLPLVIDYFDSDQDITTEEEGIILALEQRDRVRRIRFCAAVPNLQKIIASIDEEYPMLEYLIMGPLNNRGTALMLPATLQAPHLSHLLLQGFVLPIGSQLLTGTSALSIVTLCLYIDRPSTYFQPNTLLQWTSFLPQLETLVIGILFPVPNRDVERRLLHPPIITHATLPNLHSLRFRGASAYIEAIVGRINAPRLEKFGIQFFKQLTFSVPRTLQFTNTTENFRFDSAQVRFSSDQVRVDFNLQEANTYPFSIIVDCWHLDWQVSSMAQILNSHSQIFSTVDDLTLEYEVHSRSSEEHDEVDRTEWRKLLRSFGNVKTLHVGDGIVKDLSRSLRLDDGEHPLELLPELQELTYSGSGDTGDAFTAFIDARQNAGHPVTLTRSPRSVAPPALSNSSPGHSDF